MLKKSLYAATVLVTFAFMIPVHAEDISQARADIRQDKDIRHDGEDLSKDRAGLRKDIGQRKLDHQELARDTKAGDKANARRERAELNKDNKDIRADRLDIRQDRKDLRSARMDRRQDRRELRRERRHG